MAAKSDPDRWIADRMRHIESSGIRKVFELARSLKDPVNLSIGQPDFDVPEPIKAAAHAAIDRGANAYTVTQGIPELRAKIHADVRAPLSATPTAKSFITSGTSGGLVLALCCTVNPGDEVIVFDPYFVMYPHLVTLAGGTTVYVDTYPDFGIDVDRVLRRPDAAHQGHPGQQPRQPDRPRLSARTRCATWRSWRRSAAFCSSATRFIASSATTGRSRSPAEFNEDVLVLDGFSKSYGMTGWRLGFAHGPRRLIEEMTKLQQFTLRLRPEHGAARRRRRPGLRRIRLRRRLSPKARPHL